MKNHGPLFTLIIATAGCDLALGIGPTEPARDAGSAPEVEPSPDLSATPADSWSCVGHVDLWEPSSASIRVDLSVFDVETYLPPPGLSVVACRPLSCVSPVDGPVGSNDAGVVSLSLPADFKGYLTIQSDTTLPALVQIVHPVGKMSRFMPVELVSAQTVAAIALLTETRLDPSRGILLLQALDCFGNRPTGLAFNLEQPDPEVRNFYFDKQIPTITDAGTDSSGGGGLVNVPAGFMGVHAVDVATGQVVSSFSAEVQAGWVTYVIVEPE